MTKVTVDGFKLESFRPSKTSYVIPIPRSKNTIAFDVTSTKGHTLSENVLLVDDKTNVGFDFEGVHYTFSFEKSDFSNKAHKMPKGIWTPKEENEPARINSPLIYGARAGNEFLYYIAASGEEPIEYSATNLPEGLTLSSDGIIKGTTPSEGTYTVHLKVQNSYGADEADLSIVVGEKILLTPPIGWNSWYAHSEAISDEAIRNTTQDILSHGLHKYGMMYVNIDDCWQGLREEEAPYKITGKKPFKVDGISYDGFTDMKALTDFVHSKGLKIGIYMGPKISSYAGFTGASSWVENGRDEESWSPFNGNPNRRGPLFNDEGEGEGHDGEPGVDQPSQKFGRAWYGYETSLGAAVGDHWFGDIDTQQFADWGFDYIKWDWLLSGDMDLTKELVTKLKQHIIDSKRDIVLSLSNNVNDKELMHDIKDLGAQVARISFDIQDNWLSVSLAATDSLNFLEDVGDGFWPDPDMLQIGYIGVPNGLNIEFHKTNLDENAQYFQMSWWSILPAPLLLSGNVGLMDEFTESLLKNPEVIAVNQDKLGLGAVKVGGIKEVLAKKLADGSVAIGMFNFNYWESDVKFTLTDLTKATGIEFPNGARIRSLWEREDLGIYDTSFTVTLDYFQGALFKVTPI